MIRYFISIELHKLSNYVMRFIDSNIKANYNYPISGVNGWIVRYIANQEKHGKDAYQKDLEREFGITRSTASKVINRMEQKGLIRRESVAEDARLRKLVLTPAAWDIFHKMEVDHTNLERRLMRGFSEEETAQLRRYIDRMYENMMQ